MLSSHYHHHKSKTFSQLTQCPFTGTLLLFQVMVKMGLHAPPSMLIENYMIEIAKAYNVPYTPDMAALEVTFHISVKMEEINIQISEGRNV